MPLILYNLRPIQPVDTYDIIIINILRYKFQEKLIHVSLRINVLPK